MVFSRYYLLVAIIEISPIFGNVFVVTNSCEYPLIVQLIKKEAEIVTIASGESYTTLDSLQDPITAVKVISFVKDTSCIKVSNDITCELAVTSFARVRRGITLSRHRLSIPQGAIPLINPDLLLQISISVQDTYRNCIPPYTPGIINFEKIFTIMPSSEAL